MLGNIPLASGNPQDAARHADERQYDEDVEVCPTCQQIVPKEGGTTHRLLVVTGKTTGVYWPVVEGQVLTIGRGRAAEIRLRDGLASRQHAEIVGQAESCVVRDLMSANGTFVNGKPIRSKTLSEGDVITVGDTRIIFGKRVMEEGATMV